MNTATHALTRQMLEWIAARPRDYSEIMQTWRTTCPRLSIWEDACIDGLIDHEAGTGKVILSVAGREFLNRSVPTEPSTADAVEPLRTRLSADLRKAMKARDKSAIDTLRCLLAVLDNAGAQDPSAYPSECFGPSAEVPRKSLTQSELQALMQAEVNSRSEALIEYERGGRHQDAARLRAELVLISRYVV